MLEKVDLAPGKSGVFTTDSVKKLIKKNKELSIKKNT